MTKSHNRFRKITALTLAFIMTFAVMPAVSAAPVIGSSDNGDGTYNNPVIWADVPDLSMIRVGDTYWMSSTTMHMNPGVPIMKSKDMVNWETVSYCYMVHGDTDAMKLQGGSMYANGTWASSLNHRYVDDGNGGLKDEFIVIVPSPTTNKTHVFKTEDPENMPWQRYDLPARYHDCALLIDDDGRNWLTWGTNIRELNSEITDWMPGSSQRRLINSLHAPHPTTGVVPTSGLAEGLHMKKVNGMYYIIAITWPSGWPRTIVAHRAPSLNTPSNEWESKVVGMQDIRYGSSGGGIAQGSIIQAQDGKWYGFAFRDSGAVGRIPWVVPVTWVDGWPMFGKDGSYTNIEPNYETPGSIPILGASGKKSIVSSDEFYNNAKKPTYNDSNLVPHTSVAQASAPVPMAEVTIAAASGLAPGTELITNGGFETGNTTGWTFNNTFGGDSATISAAGNVKNGGEYSLKTSDRTSTGSGPMQILTDKLVAGGVYDVSFDVYYDHADAPNTKTFNLTLRLASASGTSDDNRMQIMRGGSGRKGQWTTISGTYTVPEGVDDSATAVFLETNWVSSPTLNNDLFDFYVDNVSVKVVSDPTYVDGPTDPPEPEPNKEYAYNGSNLNIDWQWNHNMDNRYWSLTERPGWLRLRTGRTVTGILAAQNTLTQRAFGPESSAVTLIDTANMKAGDEAGISLFIAKYGSIGVKMEGENKYIVTMISPDNNANNYTHTSDRGVESARVALTGDKVYLKAEANFVNQTDRGNFYYSYDGRNWTKLGDELRMVFHYANNHFMGYRFALYNFAKATAGGYVDFDFYRISDKLTGATAPTVLGAMMTGPTGVDGQAGTTVNIPLLLDPLPSGSYSGISASFEIPSNLSVTDVTFSENVTGDKAWKVNGNQLELDVTGSTANFNPETRSTFATISLQLNKQMGTNATISVIPDYVIVKGDNNIVYNLDGVQANIGFNAPVSEGAINTIANPYLPLWEHLPDNEPRIFEDPDNPGQYRAYIIGSHDTRRNSYCGPDIRMWSAPVEDLSSWRNDGAIFTYRPNSTSNWDTMYAPDMVEVRRFSPEVIARGRTPQDERTIVEYYLYPHSTSDNGMVCKSDRPDGPFEPVNVGTNGRSLGGSIVGFDPSVWVDYIDDPSDPDYNIGFRAYVYYGFQRSYADELNQETMWSRRSGTSRVDYFMPSSSSYGVIRDPAGTVYPCLAPGENPGDFNFFEAASMRKVGNKYIMVFSGYSGPDYGLGSTNSALRWAYGDSPLGPFKAGGVLVDSRGPVLNQSGSGMTTGSWGHNTHGSLWEINGQWYTTYHRPPRGNGNARQAVVAPIKIEWSEPSVLDGGTVSITGYDPYADDERWTAKASNGVEYKGAEVTSEGFYVYGLPPYRYYSAGYVSDSQGTGTLQDTYDIWDSHMPIENARNGYRAGYKYFGFGGLDEAKKGLLPFEGTQPGNNTKFNLWLTPKTTSAFTVQVWLDGPWANNTWNGTQIGTITVPADSAQVTTQFSVDVSSYVDNLDGKHAIYLVVSGGSGNLCDLIGLGFSSDDHEIERPVSPAVSISVDGEAQTIPALPIASTNANGIYDYFRYQVSTSRPSGDAAITASASDPSVKVMITQAPASGAGLVRFIYNGVTKLYRLFANFTNVATPEADEEDAEAIMLADGKISNPMTIFGNGFETSQEKIQKATAELDELIGSLGVDYVITHVGGDLFSLKYSKGNTSMTIEPFFINIQVDTVTVEGYTGLDAVMETKTLDVSGTVGVTINAVHESGNRVNVTSSPNIAVSVRNPAVASYADGVLTGLSLGRTFLDITYTDSEKNKLGLSIEIIVGEEILPSASAISINGIAIQNFSPSVLNYTMALPTGTTDINVTAEMPGIGVTYTFEPPETLPGDVIVTVTTEWGKSITYTISCGFAPAGDTFIAGTKEDSWSIINENAEKWALEKGNGLKMVTVDGDMYAEQANHENIFLQPVAGDWDIVTKVFYPVAPSETYQQAAMLVWQDNDNYFKLGAEYNGRVMVQFGSEASGSFSAINQSEGEIPIAGDGSLTIFYRITKTGNTYSGYYSLDGLNYTNMGSQSVTLNNPKVGVYATKNSTNTAIDTYCEFVSVLSLNQEVLMTPQQMLQKEVDDVLGYVTNDIPLTATENITFSPVPHGFTVTAVSDRPEVLSTTGVVTPLEKLNVDVNYQVTVSDGTRTASKTLVIKVPKWGFAPPVSDNFIGGTKDAAWSIVNPDNENWSLDKGCGLRLPTLTADLHSNTDEFYNLFLQSAEGDWEVIAKSYYPVAQNASYQQNALLVWDKIGNFVKLDCEATNSTGTRRMQFGTMTEGSFASTQSPSSGTIAPDADGSLTLYYRIKKVGNTYTGSYSRDGVTYTNIGNARTITLAEPQIGLYATKNQPDSPVIETYFEYLSVLSVNDEQLLTVDQMLQNGVDRAVEVAADLIPEYVSSDINLKLLPFSYTLTAVSEKPEVISNTGEVTTPQGDDVVVPFAITVANGTKSASKTVNITVKGSGGTIEDTLKFSAVMNEIDGRLSIIADVFSGAGDISANVNAAVYASSGKMIAVSSKAIDVSAMSREIVPFTIDVSNVEGDYTVKVFLWDKDTRIPLVKAVEPDVERDPLVNKFPETFCNPINISYRFQTDEATGWYRAMADAQPVFYKGEYWLFPTCASGYFYSSDLINWEFVNSTADQINTYAPGVFVLDDYLYVGRFNGNIYKSNNPKDGNSWTAVRSRNTSYPDPYYYMDPDTGRLFVLHGCAGLTATSTAPAVRILELDTTSPTLEPIAVNTSVPGATSAGYPVFYMQRHIRGYEVPGQLNDNYASNAQSWLEGAGLIKHNGKYYVYHCGPGTEYAGYSDASYVADDPLGPYTWCDNSPFVYKATGFTMGAAHGHDVYEQTSGRLWKFGTIAISNRHIFERRMNLYPVDFNSKGQPTTDLSYADYPMYVPTNPKGTFENQGPDWKLISYGATATASSTYDYEVTPVGATKMAPFHISLDKAFDESIRTWWSAETGDAGEWLKADLGKVYTVNAVQLNFADQDAQRLSTNQADARAYEGCYRYLLEYSVDGETWYTIADRSDHVNPANTAQDYSHDYYELISGIPMRYVRVTNMGPVPANGKFAISDLRLFGEGGGTAPGKVEDFTLSRVEDRDNRTVKVSWNPVETSGNYVGYIVRFGVDPEDLNIHYQTINDTSVIIPILSTHTDATMTTPIEYYFRIDTYNDSGRTIGSKIIKLQ